MSNHAAITVHRSREEVERLWNSGSRRDRHVRRRARRPRDRDPRRARRECRRKPARAGSLGDQRAGQGQGRPAALQAARRDGRDPALGRHAGGRAGRAQAQAAPRAAAGRVRAREGGRADEGDRLVGPQHRPGRERPRPEDPQRPRRDREDHLDGDLRLGPAPLRRLRPDDEEGRHPRPRVHGRGRRDRPRRRRTCRSATASSCRSRSPAATAGRASTSSTRCCENSNPNAGLAEKMFGHPTCRHLRLLAPHRRLRRRPGRVRARAVRRRRAAQDRGRPDRRAGSVPVGHLPDRLHGRGALRHQGRRGRSPSSARARSASSRSRARVLLGAERVIAIDQYDYRLQMALTRPVRPTSSTSPRTPTSSSSSRS